MATKTAQQLRIGDRVKRDDGEIVTVTHKGRGMIQGATLVEWDGGGTGRWGHLPKGETVDVLEPQA